MIAYLCQTTQRSDEVDRFRVSSNEAKGRIEYRAQPARHPHRSKMKTHSRIPIQGMKKKTIGYSWDDLPLKKIDAGPGQNPISTGGQYRIGDDTWFNSK